MRFVPPTPAGISYCGAIFHTRSVFHKSRKGFISLKRNTFCLKDKRYFFSGGGEGIRLIKVRLRPAVGGSAHPRCISLFEFLLFFSSNRKSHPNGWLFLLAEEKGFEPLRRFHALRDFESRLFDQLEYSSVNLRIISALW